VITAKIDFGIVTGLRSVRGTDASPLNVLRQNDA